MNIPSNPAHRKFGYTMDGDRVPLDKNGKSRISYDSMNEKVYHTWSGHEIENVYNYDGDVVELRAKGDPSDVIW